MERWCCQSWPVFASDAIPLRMHICCGLSEIFPCCILHGTESFWWCYSSLSVFFPLPPSSAAVCDWLWGWCLLGLRHSGRCPVSEGQRWLLHCPAQWRGRHHWRCHCEQSQWWPLLCGGQCRMCWQGSATPNGERLVLATHPVDATFKLTCRGPVTVVSNFYCTFGQVMLDPSLSVTRASVVSED